jgi:hypothetical protein
MDDFMAGGAKTVPFDQIGDTVTGVVLAAPEPRRQTDPETGEPKTFKNGQPMIMWAVRIATDLRDPQDPYDDGERMIYLKWKSQDAVKNAVRASGARGIEAGGILTLTLSGFGPKTKSAWNPPKEWTARYVPPTQDAFMDNGNGAPGSAAGTVGAVAPQHTPEQLTVLERLRRTQQGNTPPPAPQNQQPPF